MQDNDDIICQLSMVPTNLS